MKHSRKYQTLVEKVVNLNIDTQAEYFQHLSAIARELLAEDVLSAFDHACDLIVDHDIDVESDHVFMEIYAELSELNEAETV